MTQPDIRWKQRFQNYKKALAQLLDDIIRKIVDVYSHLFLEFDREMQKIADKQQP